MIRRLPIAATILAVMIGLASFAAAQATTDPSPGPPSTEPSPPATPVEPDPPATPVEPEPPATPDEPTPEGNGEESGESASWGERWHGRWVVDRDRLNEADSVAELTEEQREFLWQAADLDRLQFRVTADTLTLERGTGTLATAGWIFGDDSADGATRSLTLDTESDHAAFATGTLRVTLGEGSAGTIHGWPLVGDLPIRRISDGTRVLTDLLLGDWTLDAAQLRELVEAMADGAGGDQAARMADMIVQQLGNARLTITAEAFTLAMVEGDRNEEVEYSVDRVDSAARTVYMTVNGDDPVRIVFVSDDAIRMHTRESRLPLPFTRTN